MKYKFTNPGCCHRKKTAKIYDVGHTKKQSYFCSELVARALQEMWVLEMDYPANGYWPRSFSKKNEQNLRLSAGIEIGEEQVIEFS